jgi:hypothetical protein
MARLEPYALIGFVRFCGGAAAETLSVYSRGFSLEHFLLTFNFHVATNKPCCFSWKNIVWVLKNYFYWEVRFVLALVLIALLYLSAKQLEIMAKNWLVQVVAAPG